ncbi:MAG TPA: glutamine synthetase family protein [Bryobacteraceae bacterium]|nr:glutamine synthetase family protein [Bryobacteraceae bacterium]
MDRESIRRRFEDNHIRRVKLGAFDTDATLRGKYISVEKFWTAAESGLGFCDVIFGWDIGDVLYDNAKFTGWHTGYPDAHCRIDMSSYRLVPWEPGTAFFLLDFCDAAGGPLEIAPRQVFQRVLERAAERGYTAHFAAEYEFFIFRETAQSLRDKHFAGMTPLTPGMFGYSVVRASANAELVLEIMELLAAFDVPLEALHTETGPGVYEAAIAVKADLAAADRAALFKVAIKEIAGRHNLTPTFMAKWSAGLPGSSGHLHQSLRRTGNNENLFSGEAADGGMPEPMRQYVAGLATNMQELTAIFCPTINSYKRTVPGAWAPVNATWGVDNRTTAVRAISSRGKSARVELRLTGADINPYLAMAAALAAGLDGIERKLELPPPTVNAYSADASALPRTLADATRLFRESRVAREWLGEQFVEHYASTREWEVRQYEKAVTDWELARYFESV